MLVERKGCANEQYSRRECMKISGICEYVKDDDFEDCVLKMLISVTPQWIWQILKFFTIQNQKLDQRRSSLIFAKGKMCLIFYKVKKN